jgi:hypothetical protein
MGNRRFTLAIPPFAVSPQSQKSSLSSRGRGTRREYMVSTPSLSSSMVRSAPLEVAMDLEDWLNAEHFPPLSSRRNITKVAFGLPKHSQPRDEIVEKRLQFQHLPPIASLSASSVVVGNLPLNFSWRSSEDDEICNRNTDQIIEDLRPPESSCGKDQWKRLPGVEQEKWGLDPPLPDHGPTQSGGRKKKETQWVGPNCVGPSIDDLFSHSYAPPLTHTRPQLSTSRWVWVPAARVWDPEAEHSRRVRRTSEGSEIKQSVFAECSRPPSTAGPLLR